MDQSVIDRFQELDQKLATRFPAIQEKAEALAKGIADPRTADADTIWAHAWPKPLYANTKVSIGTEMVKKLRPYMKRAWRHWGASEGAVCISKPGKGISTAAFKAVTQEARRVRKQTNIAMYRLFAIQGAAGALRERATQRKAHYADLVDVDPGVMVPIVQSEMGAGWGPITVLHFLTDLGLACKPDLHLVRTVRYLGMSLDLKDQKVPSLTDAITINRRVRCLV